MKKLVFISVMVLLVLGTSAQSVKTQAKIIAGEFLVENGANKFSRVLGKALTTSGEMEYTMEITTASNTSTQNINVTHNYPNTHVLEVDGTRRVYPDEGYTWANEDPGDFNVIHTPVSVSHTLPEYTQNELVNFAYIPSNTFGVKDYATLGNIFMYNWYSDFNRDGLAQIDEFQGKKRSFVQGEEINFAFYIKMLSKDIPCINAKIYDASTGKVLKVETFQIRGNGYNNRFEKFVQGKNIGLELEPGQYLVVVNMGYASNTHKKLSITMIKERFEVLSNPSTTQTNTN